MAQCTECRRALVKTKVTERRKVAGQTFTADLVAERCEGCEETYVDGAGLEAFELAIARALATSGASSGEAFRFMRKVLAYTAAELGDLLGVASETISRWETGQRDVDRGALVAVGSLVLDQIEGKTTTLDRLRALREPPRLAKVVALDVRESSGARTA
jgi:putative zinc finger/helix-turn-helix YgiT family protein